MTENDNFITENWQGENFFTLIFFSFDVNDIFITENWAGQELLSPNFSLIFCLGANDIFFLLQGTRQGENFLCPKFLIL